MNKELENLINEFDKAAQNMSWYYSKYLNFECEDEDYDEAIDKHKKAKAALIEYLEKLDKI